MYFQAGTAYHQLLLDMYSVKDEFSKTGQTPLEIREYPRISSLTLSDMQYFTYLDSRFNALSSYDPDPRFKTYKVHYLRFSANNLTFMILPFRNSRCL